MEKHLVFVYGTLRRGFVNHSLLESSCFVGMGRTLEHYALYVGALPYVIRNDPVSPIIGELYEVDGKTLENLDDLEGHPDEYRREEVSVVSDNGEKISAWLYFYPEKEGMLLECGDYSRFAAL